MELEFNLFGASELEKVFEALPARFRDRVVATAVRAGASTLRKAARQNIVSDGSVRTGMLWRSIAVKVKRYNSRGVIWAGVGADRKIVGTDENGKRIVPANYLHLVELGTAHSRARPFLRPALDANRTKIFGDIQAAARKGLAREIAKLRVATK